MVLTTERIDRMPDLPENKTFRKDLVDSVKLARMFGRAVITIHLWRRKKGLPFLILPGGGRPAIRYDVREVRKWAKKVKRTFDEAAGEDKVE